MQQCYRACKSKTCGKALFVMFRLGVERTRQRTHPTVYDTHTRGSARRRQQTNKGSVVATIDSTRALPQHTSYAEAEAAAAACAAIKALLLPSLPRKRVEHLQILGGRHRNKWCGCSVMMCVFLSVVAAPNLFSQNTADFHYSSSGVIFISSSLSMYTARINLPPRLERSSN